MFFYLSLFIASLIIALVAHWIYNVIADAGELIHKTVLPKPRRVHPVADKRRATRKVLAADETAANRNVPKPWGWGEHGNPSQSARTAALAPSSAVPWGWPGNDSQTHEQGLPQNAKTPNLNYGVDPARSVPLNKRGAAIDWPYREDKSEFAGTAYKVTRKATRKKAELSPSGKPWGW